MKTFSPRPDGTMQSESAFQRISRASLTSIQVRVLSRLRDRPPKYETQHNYDSRLQNELQQQSSPTGVDIPIDSPTTSAAALTPRNDISIIASQAPPTYDGTRDSVTSLAVLFTENAQIINLSFRCRFLTSLHLIQ